MKRWFRLIGAACFMVAVSLLLWVCGYDGRLQFNKGLVSLCCFGVAYRLLPETFRHWKQDRRRFFYSYGISVFLALTEMMGLWLWRKENTDLALNGAMAVIVLFFCVWILAALLEPFFYWLSGWNRECVCLFRRYFSFPGWYLQRLMCLACWHFIRDFTLMI